MSYNKIFTNTVFLYGKSILTVFITMYSTRLILKAMGVDDYGIYSLIGGLITMLIFLNMAMSSATQRYISIFLGKGELDKLNAVFHTTVLFHLIIAITLVCVLEFAGLFLFDGFLNIPSNRLDAAKIIYQFVVVSTFFSINAAPYDALINAHEDMKFLAVVGVFETLLTLGIAVFITYYSEDKLVTFGLLNMFLIIISRITKSVFCKLHYSESKLHISKFKERYLFKEMFSYARWNLLGTLSYLSRTQGIGVVLNLFLGTIANTAYGVSTQLSNQVNFFSRTVYTTFRPQIIKNEGAGKRDEMISMSLVLSKMSYLLLGFVSIPILFELHGILLFWLDVVPKYVEVICTGLIISLLINQVTIGLDVAIHATGSIKRYMVITGLLRIILLPVAYVLLKLEFALVYVIIANCVTDLIAGFIRYNVFKRLVDLKSVQFLSKVIMPVAIPSIVTAGFMFVGLKYLIIDYRFVYSVISGSLVFVFSTFLFSFSKSERIMMSNKVVSILRKIQ